MTSTAAKRTTLIPRKSIRTRSISTKDERISVYFPHEQYIWISGEIINEIKKNEYEVLIDDVDIPEDVKAGMRTYCGKLDALPLQNDSMDEEGVNDMVSLNYLHEASILDNLRRRFKFQLPYTYVGNICMAVNPYQWISELYTKDLKNEYLVKPRHEMKPHVYGTSASSYKGLRDYNKNQSILVSGESGAGKTETVKILMAHLAHISRVSNGKEEKLNDVIIEKVLQSNPLLESFGNAKTCRNDNSSRFGKFTQLQFDSEENGTALIGSRCVTYLLEKSRVITQNDSKERNYHIFYQLLAAPEHVKLQLLSSKSLCARDFRFTSAGDVHTSSIEGESDASRFLKTMEALTLLGVNETTQVLLQRIIAGILFLGQINFIGDTEMSSIDPSQDVVLRRCCSLLGLEQKAFMERTTSRCLVVSGESSSLLVPLSRDQAIEARDALAKDIYFRLFSWLVMVVNMSTAVSERSSKPQERTISLLDIFGFEYFVINRFEQLNINYANEKLQQKFTEDVFATVQAEYKSEGLRWENISFKDNSDVLELLEGKYGVFASLNEECCVPKGSDLNYLSKLATRQAKHPCFSQNVHMGREGFCIHHYAGKVTYNVVGFVERNRDTLLADMRNLMLLSDNDLICQVYSPLDWSNPLTIGTGFTRPRSDSGDSDSSTPSDMFLSPRIGISGRSFATTPVSNSAAKRGESYLKSDTVLTKFKSQLTSLMASISKTNVQYVRCIKPNSIKSSLLYDRAMVVEQLRCAGVIEAIRISRAAYPYRLTHVEFLQHFGLLRPISWFNRRNNLAQGAMCKAFIDEVVTSDVVNKLGRDHSLGSSSPLNKSLPFEVGKTRIYFSSGVLEILEQLRGEKFTKATLAVQKVARGFIYRRRYARIHAAIILLQTRIRCFVSRRRFVRCRRSIIRIQSSVRGYLAKLVVHQLTLFVRATQIQSLIRMRRHRLFFIKVLSASRKVQAWYKMIYQRKKYIFALENKRRQEDLQNQLETMKQRLIDEESYRAQMQKDMEIKMTMERAEMERKFREELKLCLDREEAEKQRVIDTLRTENAIKTPVEVSQPIDERSIREEIRKELEEIMLKERELFKQQLREEMQRELANVTISSVFKSGPTLAKSIEHTETTSPYASSIAAAPEKRNTIPAVGASIVAMNQFERLSNSPIESSEIDNSISSPRSLSPAASSSDISTQRTDNYTSVAEKSSVKNLSERRGSHESGITSLDSGLTTNGLISEGMEPQSVINLQSELKKYQRKVEFLTKENLTLKSLVRSSNDEGPVLRNDREIRDRATLQGTLHSLRSDNERLTEVINQMKEEKIKMLETWSQVSAELELSNAQRDDYARKLEHEKHEYREQNRMALLFLASKRVDPVVVQELKNMFASADATNYSILSSDMIESTFKAEKPRRRNSKLVDHTDDDLSIISSVSTHRENRESSYESSEHSLTPHSLRMMTAGVSPTKLKPASRRHSVMLPLREDEERSHSSYQSKSLSYASQDGHKLSRANQAMPHAHSSRGDGSPPKTNLRFGQKPKAVDDASQDPAPPAAPTNELLDQTANLLSWMVPGLWQTQS